MMKTEFKSVDQYIENCPPEQQAVLREVRKIIHDTIPEAQEKISYDMPTFELFGGNVIHFAANKAHLGIYPGAAAIVAFAEKLSVYKTTKGAIQIPYTEPLPKQLIEEITEFCAHEREEKYKNKKR
ncbi:iron chaperone [Culicoidibacter larvae]|uniref:YdhG-like domain-containing protein n=1 Tax=Culicoidibacter larvae TaxID=2579976 RepID=A0A5R8QAB5_9FIRM|nr:DUF1801 domain-containing protein [Culicoidibacter larvae]TLG72531.1 hypothetical protein FEZ08_09085 [Culicoidibacter larvae]